MKQILDLRRFHAALVEKQPEPSFATTATKKTSQDTITATEELDSACHLFQRYMQPRC